MRQRRSSSLHYEKRLNELNDFLAGALDHLRSYDAEYDDRDDNKGFSTKAYFAAIRSKIDTTEHNPALTFSDFSVSLEQYVPKMLDELQHLGDEVIATDVYEEWLDLLLSKDTPQDHLTHVIHNYGGRFIRDMRGRHQFGPSWQAFVTSVQALTERFCKVEQEDINIFAAMDIENFILENGTDALMSCITTTSDGLGTTRSGRFTDGTDYESYYSYATESLDCYKESLELLDKTASSHNVVKFVHESYPLLSSVLVDCKEARYYYDEKKKYIYADTLNQYDCLFYSLKALKHHASPKMFYHDVNLFVPDVLDQMRKSHEGFRSADIMLQIAEWLDGNTFELYEQRHEFVETLCTREAVRLVKEGFTVNAAEIMHVIKDEFELPKQAMLILTDFENERPVAVMVGRQGEDDDQEYDEEFMVALTGNKAMLMRDNLDEEPMFGSLKDIDTDSAFRASHIQNETMKISMFIGTGEAYPIGNHLYVCRY